MKTVHIPVSLGEIVDKITILEIKAERIDGAQKLDNIRTELRALQAAWSEHFDGFGEAVVLAARLKDTNSKLWIIEDEIRDCERRQDFGETFVRLARAVYMTNDERAAIKHEINRILGSPLREEKSYKPYRSDPSGEGPPPVDSDAGSSDEADKFPKDRIGDRPIDT